MTLFGALFSGGLVMNERMLFNATRSLFLAPFLKQAGLEEYLLTLFFSLCLDSCMAFVCLPSTSVNTIIYYRINPKR